MRLFGDLSQHLLIEIRAPERPSPGRDSHERPVLHRRQDRPRHRRRPGHRADDRHAASSRPAPRSTSPPARSTSLRGRSPPSSPTSAPATASPLLADLSTFEAMPGASATSRQRREGGRLDILVNNAGANWGAPLADFPDSAWDRVLDVNVKGVFHLTRELVPALSRRVVARRPVAGHQHRLDRRAARPRPRDLLVLGVEGGGAPAHQDAGQAAWPATASPSTPSPRARSESKMMAATLDAFGDAIAAACPMGRIGEPDDMAGAAIFLSSRAGAVPHRRRSSPSTAAWPPPSEPPPSPARRPVSPR